MKRDMDLIRGILLYVEEHREFDPDHHGAAFPGHERATLVGHVNLILQHGLGEGNVLPSAQNGIVAGFVSELTWEGSDFLDAARNDSVWQRAKAYLARKGGEVPFEVMLEVLKAKAREQLGLG